MSTTSTEKPWQRRPNESAQSHDALTQYLLLGADRSLSRLSEAIGKDDSLLRRWSSRHEWQARSVAYDNHTKGVEQVARDDESSKHVALWERRRQLAIERRHSLADRIFDYVEKLMEHPVTRRKATERDAQGRATVVEIAPAKWSAATIATLLRTMAELENSCFSETLDTQEDFDPSTASEGDCRLYLEREAARRKARRGG
jgi:hypothetical protein